MAAQNLDIMRRLEAHCLPNLKYEDERLLILNVFLTPGQIARRDNAREETVKDGYVYAPPASWNSGNVAIVDSGGGIHGAVSNSAATHNLQYITTLGTYQGTNTW